MQNERDEAFKEGLQHLERHAADRQDQELMDLAALIRRLDKGDRNRAGLGVAILQLISIYLIGGQGIYRALQLLTKFHSDVLQLMGIGAQPAAEDSGEPL